MPFSHDRQFPALIENLMIAAHIDEANIIDNIQHAPDVHFDLSVQGQVYLSQHGVTGRVLTAMKTRARSGPSSAHRASR